MEHSDEGAVSRHKCLIYEGDPSEQLPVVVPLLMDGLQDNWRCLYLGSPEAVSMVDAALIRKGVDTAREKNRAALVFSSDRSHLVGGKFEPNAMIDSLCDSVDQAVKEGFQGLCATGDMRWELGADENFDRLVEYEAQLEKVFREKPLWGVCQYQRGMVPAQAIRAALAAHRTTYVGDVLDRDNLFYVPPELLLADRDGGDGAKYAEWMCRQIVRVVEAERSRDEVLRDLERRVSERTSELAVLNRHLRSFSYSVSHDLRAPLRAITGYGEAISEDCGDRLSTQGKEDLSRLLAAARHMSDLIDGMLALGRIVEADLHRVPVDLSALARDVARELQAGDPHRSVEIVIHDDLKVTGDPALLRAVLSNLLGNAWKFTARRPAARIEMGQQRDDSGAVVFFVHDNGAGFNAHHTDKLFGVFQRLHRQDEFPGTGVGLATVDRIICRHGGRIWAEGRPGEGATFFFTIPARDTGGHEALS